MEIAELARKYAVKNAVDYGKAIPGPIISKLMSTPGAKIEEMSKIASEASQWANSLSLEQMQAEYSKYSQEFDEEKKVKTEKTAKPKMELPGATRGNFHTRFAPGPSGYAHIGHAKAALLASAFAEIYEGKISLYFDDSNPEVGKQEYVDAFRSDMKWLGIKFSDEYYASDNIPKIYEYAKQLLTNGNAYACSCSAEEMKEKRMKGVACGHSAQTPTENLAIFKQMLSEDLEEGDTVIRFKGDIKSDNTALRDPTILRIKKEDHYRQKDKYVVWPLYDFNTPINDYLHGITDVIRSKEYELRNPLYYMIMDALNLPKPRIHLEARLTIKNNLPSKRYQRIYIEQGLLSGYDDPRLVTISALRRREVRPAAIKEFVLRFGMSKVDSVVDISMLLDENKKLVDPEAKRLYYVENPVKVVVEGAHTQTVDLKLHPSANMGKRSYKVDDTFYISGADAQALSPGTIFKLKGLISVRVKSYEKDVIMGALTEEDSKLKFQWVPEKHALACQVIMPKPPLKEDGEFDRESLPISNGYIEDYASKLKEKEVVQLERFGFSVLDNKSKMSFVFMTK
jgi:glutamyl-tRNA synthetase